MRIISSALILFIVSVFAVSQSYTPPSLVRKGFVNASTSSSTSSGISYTSSAPCAYTKVSSTQIKLFSGASATTPCIVGNPAMQITQSYTLDISGTSSSGTGFVYVTQNGNLTFGHNTATTFTPQSGLTVATSTSTFPDETAKLFTPSWTSNVWDDYSASKDFRYPMATWHSHDCIGCISSSYNPTTGKWTFTVSPEDPTDPSILTYREDFIGNFSQTGWRIVNATVPCGATSATPQAAEGGRPGIQRVSTSSTINSGCAVMISNVNASSTGMIPNLGAGADLTSMNSLFTFKSDTSDVTNTWVAAGYTNQQLIQIPGTHAASFIGFRVDTLNNTSCASINGGASGSITAGHIFVETRSSSNSNCIDTGLTYTSNTWYRTKISVSTVGTIDFAIATASGTGTFGSYGSTMSSSTNVPTTAMVPTFAVADTTTGGVKSIDLDKCVIRIYGMS